MKKVFFSMAGIALVAGSALAFSTAKNNNPLPCDHPSVDKDRCIVPTSPDDQESCCFKIIDNAPQYYRLLE